MGVRCILLLRTQVKTAKHCLRKFHPNITRTMDTFVEVIVLVLGQSRMWSGFNHWKEITKKPSVLGGQLWQRTQRLH